MLGVECALGPPVEDSIRLREHARGCQVVIAPAHLAGGHSRTAEAGPCPIRTRQHYPHLPDSRVAVDDDEQLGPVDRPGASGNRSLRPRDPSSLIVGAVDDHAR